MRSRILLISLSSFFLPLCLFAQPQIEVSEASAKFDGEKRNALSVTTYGEKQDEVEDKARKAFRGWGNVKNREAPLFIKEAEWDELGDHPFNFYLKVEKQEDSTQKVLVGVNLGGAWLNSGDHSERYKAMSKRLREFAVKVTKEAMEGVIEKEQEKLEALQSKLEDLNSSKEDKKSTIEDKKETIEEAKKTIEDAKKAIEDAKARIEELKKKKEKQKKKVEAQKKELEEAKKKKEAVK
ncbi:MAG: coiled-coil domain-containing protein [Flavobacteriales bacterium]